MIARLRDRADALVRSGWTSGCGPAPSVDGCARTAVRGLAGSRRRGAGQDAAGLRREQRREETRLGEGVRNHVVHRVHGDRQLRAEPPHLLLEQPDGVRAPPAVRASTNRGCRHAPPRLPQGR